MRTRASARRKLRLAPGGRSPRNAVRRAALAAIPLVAACAATAPAQAQEVCANMATLDKDTQQLCRYATELCMLSPAVMLGDDKRAALTKCITEAVTKGRQKMRHADSLARCEEDADQRPRAGIASCAAAIKTAAGSPQELATAYAYRGLAYSNEAIDLLEAGKDEQALTADDHAMADANQALRIDRQLGDAYLVRGFARYTRWAEAIHAHKPAAPALIDAAVEDLTQAIGHNLPNSHLSLAFRTRADIYYGRQHYDLAVKDYTECLRLDPRNALALYRRGVSETKTGNAAAGDADIQEARRIDPSITN